MATRPGVAGRRAAPDRAAQSAKQSLAHNVSDFLHLSSVSELRGEAPGSVANLIYRHPIAQMSRQTPPATISGLTRAFRQWAQHSVTAAEPDVPGASPQERRMLGALGGIAASVTDGIELIVPQAVREWTASAPSPPPFLVESVRDWLGRGKDPLGDLYNACVSSVNRRQLGTVFTPDPLVD